MKKTDLEKFIDGAIDAIDEEKIVFVGQDAQGRIGITLGGKRFEGAEAKNLQNEAKMVLNSRVWGVLYETLRKTAQNYLFTQMKTLDDANYGKSMLYNLSVQKKVLEHMAELTLSTPPPLTREKEDLSSN